MPYSCNTWIGVFPGLAVIIFPKLQKPEKGVLLCMPKQAGKQKHAEASPDCHQAPRRPGPVLARRTISRTRGGGHRAEAGRVREVFKEIIQGQVLHPLRTKPTNPKPPEAAYRPRPPQAARGAGPGRRSPRARSQSAAVAGGASGGRGLYPECRWRAGCPPPPLLRTTPHPAGLGPDSLGADLKVSLSSRSSGGAAARCLLWDMARRDGLEEGGRAVRSDVLAPASAGPRKEHSSAAASSLFLTPPLLFWLASLLRRGRAGVGRRRGLGAAAEFQAPGHSPSLIRLGVHLLAWSRPPAPGVWSACPRPPLSRPRPLSQPRFSSAPAVPSPWPRGLLRPRDSVFFERLFPLRSEIVGRASVTESMGPEAQSFFFFGGARGEGGACVTLRKRFQNSECKIYGEHLWAWPWSLRLSVYQLPRAAVGSSGTRTCL